MKCSKMYYTQVVIFLSIFSHFLLIQSENKVEWNGIVNFIIAYFVAIDNSY